MSKSASVVPSRRESRYYAKARTASLCSDHHKTKIGAAIVLGNYVVSTGHNREKSHPRQHHYDQLTGYFGKKASLHAEVSALINSGRADLTGAEIYIYRLDKNGDLANCRPCVSCARALKDAGITHVFYTDASGHQYEQFDL